jgi:hypothetical protein
MIEEFIMLRKPDTNFFGFPFCRVRDLHKRISDDELRDYVLLKTHNKETHILYEYCHKSMWERYSEIYGKAAV